MPFRVSNAAHAWFRYIPEFKDLMFESYYFCLVAGLAAGRKKKLSTSETRELVDRFPSKYQHVGRLLIGLMIRAELKEMGITFDEREAVYSVVADLVNPESPSSLSDKGMNLMNQYSWGGYECLVEFDPEPPRTLSGWLSRIPSLMSRVGDESSA